jgi:hypothetical protein
VLRSARPLAIAVAVLAGVALGAWLAGRGGGSASAPVVRQRTVSRPGAPTAFDPTGAYLAASRAGAILVGVAARPGGPVDVIAIPPDLGRLRATAVRARVGASEPEPASCGARCYRFPLRVLEGRPVRLVATVSGRPVGFALPARLPPAVPKLLARANERMARVGSVRVDETLSSGSDAIRARFDLAAPDRMRYAIAGGGRAVVIGTTRWDLVAGRWQRSDYQRIRQPAYMWEGARYARRLGSATLDGRNVDVIAAFRPDASYPAWFRLYVAPSGHIVRSDMIAPAHFMVDRLSAFGRAGPIRPPS